MHMCYVLDKLTSTGRLAIPAKPNIYLNYAD